MKEKLLYLFIAFCMIVNVFLIGVMINENKVEAEVVIEEYKEDNEDTEYLKEAFVYEDENEDEYYKTEYSSICKSDIIYAKETYKESDLTKHYKDDGYIINEKNYPINITLNDVDNNLQLKLKDYTLINVATDYGDYTEEKILRGGSHYYITIDFELKNKKNSDYLGSFYDFGLKYENENDRGYKTSPSYFNNDIYIPDKYYLIEPGETLKGKLTYELGFGYFDGYEFNFIWHNEHESLLYKNTMEVNAIEIAKRNDKN